MNLDELDLLLAEKRLKHAYKEIMEEINQSKITLKASSNEKRTSIIAIIGQYVFNRLQKRKFLWLLLDYVELGVVMFILIKIMSLIC
jgi:hypothetical protein